MIKNKNIKTLRSLKGRLKKCLPEKISQVMESYENFSEQPIPEDAKGFSAHHNACKSAVIHAETLLKLARWTTQDENKQPDVVTIDDNLKELLEEAEQEYEEFTDEEY